MAYEVQQQRFRMRLRRWHEAAGSRHLQSVVDQIKYCEPINDQGMCRTNFELGQGLGFAGRHAYCRKRSARETRLWMFKWFEEMGIGDSQGADLMGWGYPLHSADGNMQQQPSSASG